MTADLTHCVDSTGLTYLCVVVGVNTVALARALAAVFQLPHRTLISTTSDKVGNTFTQTPSGDWQRTVQGGVNFDVKQLAKDPSRDLFLRTLTLCTPATSNQDVAPSPLTLSVLQQCTPQTLRMCLKRCGSSAFGITLFARVYAAVRNADSNSDADFPDTMDAIKLALEKSAQKPEYRRKEPYKQAVFSVLDLAMASLTNLMRERYRHLAAFPEAVSIPLSAIRAMWWDSLRQEKKILDALLTRGLLRRVDGGDDGDEDGRRYVLHKLQYEHLQCCCEPVDLRRSHQRLLKGFSVMFTAKKNRGSPKAASANKKQTEVKPLNTIGGKVLGKWLKEDLVDPYARQWLPFHVERAGGTGSVPTGVGLTLEWQMQVLDSLLATDAAAGKGLTPAISTRKVLSEWIDSRQTTCSLAGLYVLGIFRPVFQPPPLHVKGLVFLLCDPQTITVKELQWYRAHAQTVVNDPLHGGSIVYGEGNMQQLRNKLREVQGLTWMHLVGDPGGSFNATAKMNAQALMMADDKDGATQMITVEKLSQSARILTQSLLYNMAQITITPEIMATMQNEIEKNDGIEKDQVSLCLA